MNYYGNQPQPSIFDQKKGRIQNTIKQVSDANQLTEQFCERLARENSLGLLQLNIDARSISTYRTALRMAEIPAGVSFSMSNPDFEITSCTIPFIGPKELAELAMKGTSSQFVELHTQNVVAKSYDSCAHPDLEKAKTQLKRSVESVQGYFSQINSQATEFNNSLPGYIASLVHNQKVMLDARNAKNDAMDPFK